VELEVKELAGVYIRQPNRPGYRNNLREAIHGSPEGFETKLRLRP
jgi:hypothetical protein